MAEIWVIKSSAHGEFVTTQIPFTSNGQKFTSIGTNSDGTFFILCYDSMEIAGYDPGVDTEYIFDDEAYRKLTFDTPPTGALLSWLQANATKQVVEYLVTDTDLIKVANAIRAKSGTTEKLSFPDGMASAVRKIPSGVTGLSLGITGAQVGQIAKITAVDTDGKPTAWEAVDMATGEWALLDTGETQEVVKTISVDVDLQEINELLVFVRTHGSSDSVDSHLYWGIGTSSTAFGIPSSLHRSQWRLHALKLQKIKGERWFGTVEYGYIQGDQIDAGNVQLAKVEGFKILAGAENKIAFGAYYYGNTELVAGTAYQVWGRQK